MLIKESTLRRIIREESRRALREADDIQIPIPITTTTPAYDPFAAAAPAPKPQAEQPAPGTVQYNDPAAIKNMIKNIVDSAPNRQLINNVWVHALKSNADVQKSSLTMTFTVTKEGTVDPKTIKVTCAPDVAIPDPSSPTGSHPMSTEFVKVIAAWKFYKLPAPTSYTHPTISLTSAG